MKNDLILKVENCLAVEELKEIFKKKGEIEGRIDNCVIRMFFRGKEMKDQNFIGEFGIGNEDMVVVFLQAKN